MRVSKHIYTHNI